MRLMEYKAKELMKRYGIPVPDGFVASSPDQITDVPKPVMVKAQVLIGGRGKAGGIKPADGVDDAREAAASILGIAPETLSSRLCAARLSLATLPPHQAERRA